MNNLTPYYEKDGITIYCGDNREILPLLGTFDLLLTDPPYGIKADKKMAKNNGKWGYRNYGPTNWDESRPEPWVIDVSKDKSKWQIIWGGNYYELPPTTCWLIWNKMQRDFDFADGEMAWTSLDKAIRIYDYSRGQLIQEGKEHPTQKPICLMSWCIGHAPESETILDPWMGSGTTLVAAKLRGKKAVGIEINEQYCEIAKRRLAQGVLIAV
jgi:DNA modification methylase